MPRTALASVACSVLEQARQVVHLPARCGGKRAMEPRRDQVGVVSDFVTGQAAGRDEQVVRARENHERSGTVLSEFLREGDGRAQGGTDTSCVGVGARGPARA